MAHLGIVFGCLLLGVLARRLPKIPPNAAAILNKCVIYFSLPALALSQAHRLHAELATTVFPIASVWIVFVLAILILSKLGKFLGWNRETVGAVILTSGLSNTSFVGFPLLIALIGPQALPIGVLIDQMGSFLALSTLGVAIAATYSGRTSNWKTITREILKFPPVWGLTAGFLLRPVVFPGLVDHILDALGSSLTPLALTAVGLQLRLSTRQLRQHRDQLSFGLTFKLLMAPLLILIIGMLVSAKDLFLHVPVLEAAMAPMITGAILAEENGLNPELVSLMLGIGIPLSLVTVPIWSYFLFTVMPK